MTLRDYFRTNTSAQYWLGQAVAYRTAAGWVHLRPQTSDSFRSMMRQAAIYAAQDAKWARKTAQLNAKLEAAGYPQ